MIPEVVEKLTNNGYRFKWYCIGEGVLKKELEYEIDKRNIQENLSLLGIQKNPYVWLKDCDLYVQTSLHEGYGLTIHEAKLFDKPIVTTNFTGVTEQIKDNLTGKIVAISSEGLYNGIKELLDNPNLQKTFSKNLRVENEKNNEEKIIVL